MEAADLGVLLLRALFRPTLWAWLGFVLPLQLLVLWTCSSYDTGYRYLAVWWLKPVYDRAFGLVLGRGLFGPAPTGFALYRALWAAGRRGLAGDLLWRRLDPARTLVSPVALLEGLTGRTAARRRKVLSQGNTNAAGLILAACVALELAITAGCVMGVHLATPDEAAWIVADLWSLSEQELLKHVVLGSWILTQGLVEPLFVASGFGLYINRRTHIEGWDVELTFRRMARRLASKATAAALALLSLVGPFAEVRLASAQPAPDTRERAAEFSESAMDESQRLPVPEPKRDGTAEAAMSRVLARPELQRVHEEVHWELRHASDERQEAKPHLAWLERFAAAVAEGFEYLLWGLAALALAFVIYLVILRSPSFQVRAAPSEELPAFAARIRAGEPHVPTLAISDVVPQARALMTQGREVAALSVLYVGTLTALMQRDGVELPPQATEGQCLAVVRRAPIAEERRALFVELTRLWQLSAYAHAQPEHARLTDLCARFHACFAEAP
jgi:hypothetical protein